MSKKTIEQVLKEKKIHEIVNDKFLQINPQASIKDAVRLMRDKKSGYVVVSKDKQIIGMFTEKELIQKVMSENVNWDNPVCDYVSSNHQVLSLSDSVGTAIDTMGKQSLYFIPLVNEKNEFANTISVRTLIRFLAAFYPDEVYNLPPRPDQISTSPEGG
jgi:signal-transduction protein with cAMP-binding, CBS, and nucleotidyltransferase domain